MIEELRKFIILPKVIRDPEEQNLMPAEDDENPIYTNLMNYVKLKWKPNMTMLDFEFVKTSSRNSQLVADLGINWDCHHVRSNLLSDSVAFVNPPKDKSLFKGIARYFHYAGCAVESLGERKYSRVLC
jgi:hypothetical protein